MEIGVAIAIISAFITGLTTVIDKYLVENIISETGTLMLTSKFSMCLIAIVLVGVLKPSLAIGVSVIWLLLGYGVLKSGLLFGYFRLVSASDVTMVSPILSAQPIFTAVLAYVLIDERLTLVSYIGVALTVFGIVLMSLSPSGLERDDLEVNTFAIAATILSILYGGAAVLLKHILSYTSFWTAFFWTACISTLVVFPFLLKSSVRTELSQVIHQESNWDISLIGLSEVISSVSGLMLIIAYSYAPASIVNATMSLNTVFGFLLVTGIMKVGYDLDKNMARPDIMRKGLATLLVSTGVALFALI